ncbi:hypothetical protein Tco_0047668 [Tanacetum coccineum]
MVAYLEKTNGNTDFHEIIDFLTRSSIHYALIVIITAKVAGKPVTISEASIRSDLLFDDADEIDSMHNHAIFDVIQLMGYEGDLTVLTFHKALFSPQWRFLFHTMNHCISSKNQHETQPDPSPRLLPTIPIPDSIPEGSGRNHRGQSSSDRSLSGNEDGLTLQSVYDLCVSLCKQVTNQAKEIKHLKAQIKKLKKKAKPVITHHKTWMKSVSMKHGLAGKQSLKKNWTQKESVSKQGRKLAKAEPTVHKDPAFDDLDDIMDYMESEDAQDEGRTSYVVLEEKESAQKGVSTEVEVSTVKPDKGTGKSKVSIDKPEVSTAKPKEVEVSTDKLDEETIAEFLVSMSQNKAKQKSVEIKDAKDSDRPRATSTISVLTLKPLPKIDPKDKGKKVLEEEAERNFDQLAKDEEIARKVQEDWEVEEGMKKLAKEEATKAALIQDFDDIQARIEADRLLLQKASRGKRNLTLAEEEATKAALIQDFDDIQARIEADRLLAARLQEEERETLTVEENSNFFMILLSAPKEVPCSTKSCCNQKQTTNKNSAKKPK